MFNYKAKRTRQTRDNARKNVEMKVPLKYLSKFWRTLEILTINCKINLIQTCSGNCVIVSTACASQGAAFSIWGHLSTKIMQNYYNNQNQVLIW